jgi:hypothetical protein
MHSTGSILLTACERVRQYIDSADLDAKYDNDYLVNHIMCPSMADVMTRVSMMRGNPIIIRHTLTVSADQEYYILPHGIGQVWRLAVLDEAGNLLREAIPRGEFNPRGPGWKIEGNMIAVRPWPLGGETFDIWYTPSGFACPHYSTAGGRIEDVSDTSAESSSEDYVGDGRIFRLGAAATGQLDKRPGAYVGCYLRLLEDVHESRVIVDHDVELGEVQVRLDFNEVPESDTAYEIVPYLLEPMLEAVTCRMAMKMGLSMRISRNHMEDLKVEYVSSIKSSHDILANIMGRLPKFFDRETVDNYGNYWDLLVNL